MKKHLDNQNQLNTFTHMKQRKKGSGGRRQNSGRKRAPEPLKTRGLTIPAHWPWDKGIRAKIKELLKKEHEKAN